MVRYGLHHLNVDTMEFILNKAGYNSLAAFEAKYPNFKFTLEIPTLNPLQNGFVQASCLLSNFTFSQYKNCLLVKHQQNLKNSAGVSNEFKADSFSRPMYWNYTLGGWIASTKDINHLEQLGATQLSN